jgi:hypothetical protein
MRSRRGSASECCASSAAPMRDRKMRIARCMV